MLLLFLFDNKSFLSRKKKKNIYIYIYMCVCVYVGDNALIKNNARDTNFFTKILQTDIMSDY